MCFANIYFGRCFSCHFVFSSPYLDQEYILNFRISFLRTCSSILSYMYHNNVILRKHNSFNLTVLNSIFPAVFQIASQARRRGKKGGKSSKNWKYLMICWYFGPQKRSTNIYKYFYLKICSKQTAPLRPRLRANFARRPPFRRPPRRPPSPPATGRTRPACPRPA